jgi:hypothetical protein
MRTPRSGSYLFLFRLVSIISLVSLAFLSPSGAFAASSQLVVSPVRVAFGDVLLKQSETEMVTLTNSGTTSISISAISLSDAAFSLSGVNFPVNLGPGASTSFSVTFAPTEAGNISAKASVTTTASTTPFQFAVSGGGAQFKRLQASPASVSFGNVAVGKTLTIPVVVTNVDSLSLPMSGFYYFGNGFSAAGPSLPTSLGPKQTTTVNITFTPTAAGPATGSVYIQGAYLNIPVNGTGTTATTTPPNGSGTLSVSPTSVSFGNVQLGTSTTQSSSMKATGGTVTVNSVASSNSQFAVGGVTFPMTITSGLSIPYQVTYTPTKSGSATATLSFATSASTTATTEAASGTGTNPYVTLSWSASSSAVSGYNIYRGTTPGTYSKLNPSLDATTTYTDSTVAPGTTYYYAATSVNSSGQESGYSSPIQVSVP